MNLASHPTIVYGHVTAHCFNDDGQFPNNPALPLLVYKGVFNLLPEDEAERVQQIFEENGWGNAWVNGIFDYHHYHSTAHEVLGIACGKADVQFGGPHGTCVELSRGDAVIIPAGVAHKNLNATDDFKVVGAYASGRDFDMNYGKDGERPQVDKNISEVPLPETDPIFKTDAHLVKYWNTPYCS